MGFKYWTLIQTAKIMFVSNLTYIDTPVPRTKPNPHKTKIHANVLKFAYYTLWNKNTIGQTVRPQLNINFPLNRSFCHPLNKLPVIQSYGEWFSQLLGHSFSRSAIDEVLSYLTVHSVTYFFVTYKLFSYFANHSIYQSFLKSEGCLTAHLPREIKWNVNLMQQGDFIDAFLARHVSGT